jgi:hypothetical protein
MIRLPRRTGHTGILVASRSGSADTLPSGVGAGDSLIEGQRREKHSEEHTMNPRAGHWKLGLLLLGSAALPSTLSAAVMLECPRIDVQEICTRLQDLFPNCSSLYPDLPSHELGVVCDDSWTQTQGGLHDLLGGLGGHCGSDMTSFVSIDINPRNASVPEPASLLLLTTGLAALGARRGLRRKTSR